MLAAFLIGFVGSLHCVSMCGPLVLAMPFNDGDGNFSISRILAYHIGKLSTYAILGILVGLAGGGLRFFFVQQWISIASGILLLLFYFLPKIMNQSRFPSLSNAWNKHVVVRMKKQLQVNDSQNPTIKMFSLGLLNGILPCGLVYIALLSAIAEPTVLQAALFMAVFGLGTSPALTGIILANKMILNKLKSNYSKIIPALVIVVSSLLILRGLGLGIPIISPESEDNCCHSPEASVKVIKDNSLFVFGE